jgi:hypothetical protein
MQRAIKRFKPMGWRPFMTDLTDAHRALIQSSVVAQLIGAGSDPRAMDMLAQVRALPQYGKLSARLWGAPDTDPIGEADSRYREGARRGG